MPDLLRIDLAETLVAIGPLIHDASRVERVNGRAGRRTGNPDERISDSEPGGRRPDLGC